MRALVRVCERESGVLYSGKFLDDHPAVSAVVLVKVDFVDLSVTDLYGTILLCELQMRFLYKDNQEKDGKSVDTALFMSVLMLFHDITMQRKKQSNIGQNWPEGRYLLLYHKMALQTTASLET